MKGLILKDVYGCRFQIAFGFAFMLLPMLMMALSGGGMSVVGETPTQIVVFLFGMINYMSIVICSSFYLNTLAFDEASGWIKMQRAMPLSGGQIIGGKFLGVGAVVGSLTAISLAFNAASSIIFGIPIEPMLTMPLCVGLAEISTLLPTIVLGYRFGAKSMNWVYFIFLIAIAAGAIALSSAYIMGDIGDAAMRVIAYVGIPLFTAAVAVVCCVTGKKVVMVDI